MRFFRLFLPIIPILTSAAAAETDFVKDVEPILLDYCFDCHGDGMDKGDFSLDYESLDEHLNDFDTWFKVWENTRSQLMPPSDESQPSLEQRDKLLTWIEKNVFGLDPENPDPGRVTVRRLNREEYENTIRDLFGHNFNANEAFPPDDSGYGFDNIGDVLSISPLLMEKYFEAARDITSQIVHTSGPIIPTSYLGSDQFVSEKKRKSNWVPFNRPEVFVKNYRTDHPGDYQFHLDYKINGAENDTDHTARMMVRVNGQQVLEEFLAWGDTQTQKLSRKAKFNKGDNKIEIELVQVSPPKDGQKELALQVQNVRLHGPLDGSHRVYPGDYNKIFIDGPPPADEKAREAYFRKLIAHWGRRIWRRPLEGSDVERLSGLAGGSVRFEQRFAQAMIAMLISPRFLFRAEIQPEPNNPGKIVPIDEFALASRLSYFLWSSTPDDRLLDLAASGELRKNLRAEVQRMIEDGKSDRFVRNFTGQWLQTRDLDLVYIDPRRILGMKDKNEAEKYYNYRTKQAMRDETELFFRHILREDRSVLDLLDADYTFLNEDLAYTYGIDGVKGRNMQKVSLKDGDRRGGILTQGTFLVITSNPTRTSPVKRGLFVLENLLGTPAPPAPEMEIPTVEEQARKKDNRGLTMRELMAVHREDPLCASCHARFDPIGVALENYNALGMWREKENGKPIEAGGKLITGEKFADATELSRILATERRTDFYRCLAEKLLTYAIGRGVEFYDAPTIDRIARQLDADGGKMSTLIHGIIESAPFQKRRGDGDGLSMN